LSEKMEHSNTTVSSGKFGQIWVSTFYTHLHTYIPFVKVGTGFCPIGAFGRTPGHRRLAKCDAGSSRTGGFFPAAAGNSLHCSGTHPHVGAAWAFLLRRAHIRSRGAKPYTAATRASRRGAGVLPADRVDRVDFSHGGKIGTFGTSERDQPLSVAAVGLDQNSVFP